MMEIHEIINIIENNEAIYEILKYCPYEILKSWKIKKYTKNSIILNQGEIYDSFYIIAQGIADIYIMAENGKRYSQATYNKGYFIGELEIFDKVPFSCFIEAMTDVTLLEINRENFLKWLDLDKNISSYITRTLCRQFYNLSKKAGSDTLYTLKQRICQYLISCSGKINKSEIELNKEKLSEQLAVTQRSINRVLKELKEKDLIDIKTNSIVILDLQSLKEEEEISRYE